MAKKEAAATPEQGEAAATGNKKKRMLMIGGAAGVLVLVLGVVLGWVLLGGKDKDEDAEEEATAKVPALYVALGEKFVATLPAADGKGKPHYLQVAISAMTHDKAVTEVLEFNAPLLRDRLNSLLARQEFDRLRTEEGKLALRGEVLATVQGIVDSEIASSNKVGKDDEDEEEEEKPAKKKKKGEKAVPEEKPPGVEEIYFTEFVLQ